MNATTNEGTTMRQATILIDGKVLTVPQAQADDLQAAGVPFAYLCRVQTKSGWRTVTVPVN
jgi:hypothetical protein